MNLNICRLGARGRRGFLSLLLKRGIDLTPICRYNFSCIQRIGLRESLLFSKRGQSWIYRALQVDYEKNSKSPKCVKRWQFLFCHVPRWHIMEQNLSSLNGEALQKLKCPLQQAFHFTKCPASFFSPWYLLGSKGKKKEQIMPVFYIR